MASLPDNRMRDLLANARKYSSDRLAVEAASGVHKQPNLEQQHQANSRTIPIQVRDQQQPSSNTSRAKSVGMANSYNSMRQSASPRRVSTRYDHKHTFGSIRDPHLELSVLHAVPSFFISFFCCDKIIMPITFKPSHPELYKVKEVQKSLNELTLN